MMLRGNAPRSLRNPILPLMGVTVIMVFAAGMPTHKFQIGQTVFLNPSLALNVPGGAYIVTKKFPERDGEFVYQVKSAHEPHERCAKVN